MSLSPLNASADSHLLLQSSNAQNATPVSLSLSFLLLLLHSGLLVFKLFKICKKVKLGCWFMEVHSQCFSSAPLSETQCNSTATQNISCNKTESTDR